jgi:2,2-dialkylglycine decarboxylase (pyruvate)
MDRSKAARIVSRYAFPTERSSYMGGLESRPILAESEGSVVRDTDGRAYLDFQSGQMGAALGHQHPRIVARISQTMQSLLHASNAMLSVPRLRLHARLGRMLPKPLTRSLFLVSGSDAIEAAVDLARKATGGTEVLGMHAGLHGSTSHLTRSLSFNWSRRKHAVVAPATSALLAPYCYRCPLKLRFPGCDMQCLDTSLELADANMTGKPAAVIVEPILSAGGVIVPPRGYLARLQAQCRARDMLLIADESQTGLGKTGKLFGFQHEAGVLPDVMVLSKHFGGGLPISAVCTSTKVGRAAVQNGYFATRSHAADPLLCAAGEESLDIVEDEDMPRRARRIERRIRRAVAAMARRFGVIGDVRGRGVLLGIEFVEERRSRAPANDLVARVAEHCLAGGLIFQVRGVQSLRNVIRLVPPMTTSDAEVDQAMGILEEGIARALGGRSPRRR